MMHHPNMHHQPMSGHPPQHMGGHQGMPGHHQMPHQMHRENRHVTLTRVAMGPSQPGGGMGGHGQAMGGMGAMGVPPPHHGPGQRPPHPIRPMPHHPQAQHHSVPPQQMKPMRRPYMGGGYGPGSGPGVMPPPYAQPPRQPQITQPPHAGLRRPLSPISTAQKKLMSDFVVSSQAKTTVLVASSGSAEAATNDSTGKASAAGAAIPTATACDSADDARAAPGDSEAARPAPANPANSKEKTPMCLVNELARYNKIKHQYRLTSETGPAHKKVFTVTLRLGDTEEYTAEGSSIKRAQHAAASAALTATAFPPPPPRAAPPHQPHNAHHRHSGTVMPTVELNALAMKLCQPAVYTSIPPVAAGPRAPRVRVQQPLRLARPPVPVPGVVPGVGTSLLYRVRVCVGGRAWLGEGGTPQGARHDAAARALHDLRPAAAAAIAAGAANGPAATGTAAGTAAVATAATATDGENGEANGDILNSEVKSPVSLVHELALKRNLTVQFSVKSERGPPHMRVFVTLCTVGEIETEGEGNGKKVSKRRAASRMLEEMRVRWPPALLRPRPPHDKRRHQPAKKKPRNLIKEGASSQTGGGSPGGGDSGADNPISRLAVARHAVRARSPQYRVLEERGAGRRREFLVQCDAPPHAATGLGPNKKAAKRRAAINVLLAMEMSTAPGDAADCAKTSPDSKRKEGSGSPGAPGERQPVPGVLMMDYQRAAHPPQPNGVSEVSAPTSGGSTPGAKDQLMYLSQLLGFTVQFSDFPKRNHGEYLSLVSLSTEPPVMCHGGGASTQHSHEQCARAALRALALMGLDAHPTHEPGLASAAPGAAAVSNGLPE